jgi:hypothetical protein
MTLPYQTEPTVEGVWYISELPQARRRTPGDRIETAYPGASRCRLAGGFSSEAEARDAERELIEAYPEYRGRTYVWQPSG